MADWMTTDSGRKVKLNTRTLAKATRMIQMNPNGTFGCFEGEAPGRDKGAGWQPKEVGTTPDIATAERWLEGQDVSLKAPPLWVRVVDRFRS